MDKLDITHYFYPGTDPWKNIMDLPEQEAFRVASELADKYPADASMINVLTSSVLMSDFVPCCQ